MLKKMRWRFILAAMAAFFTVVVILLCIINVWNSLMVARQQMNTLHHLYEVSQFVGNLPGRPPFEKLERFSPEVAYMLRFFSVHFDRDGQITHIDQTYIASIDQEQAAQYATAALAKHRTSGYYQGYRYLIIEEEAGTTVIFLNSERELQGVQNLLIITIVIALGCLLVVFLLIVLFSRKAIAPYARNLEAQKQFITNASHELKTPLTAIATSADVLAMEHEGDEWVQSIQSQAAKLSKLITNLVTLSRLNEENPFPVRTEFSLSDALWEITEPFIPLAKAKGKAYSQEIEDNLTFTGDRIATQQMVSILLDNAMKYAPEAGNIHLEAKRIGKKIIISVSNTCANEVQLDLSRLFDRFYRADESHSTAVDGSGIGLSIAKATAEAQGGSIQAEQKDGVITFRVRL